MDSAKRTIELEVVSKWLKEENRSLIARNEVLKQQYLDESQEKDDQIHKLKGEVMAMKDREEMWSKAEEKCRLLEVEKGKLEMDLKAAEAENKALQRTLEDKHATITMLDNEKRKIEEKWRDWLHKLIEDVDKARKERPEGGEKMKVEEFRERIDVLEKEKGEMKAEVQKLEREILEEKKHVLNEKMAMEAKEKKMTELVQSIKVLEKENVTLNAEKMTVKVGGEEKFLELGHRIDILEREKQRLEEEFTLRIDVINKLAVNLKSEDNADLPQNNVCIFGNPAQNQGKRKQSLLENSSGGDGSTVVVVALGNSSIAKRTRPSM